MENQAKILLEFGNALDFRHAGYANIAQVLHWAILVGECPAIFCLIPINIDNTVIRLTFAIISHFTTVAAQTLHIGTSVALVVATTVIVFGR